MKQARQHDMFVVDLARDLLDAPAMIHRELGLADSVPMPPILKPRDEARLRQIIALDDVTPGQALAAIKRAYRSLVEARDRLKLMLKISQFPIEQLYEDFGHFAFTRAEIEAMPESYRQAVIVQRRRAKIRVVAEAIPETKCT